jgi:hypothetical protein
LAEDPGRLHDWMFDRGTEADAEVLDEVHAGTGAVVMGKRMVDIGIEAALEQATGAAGEKNVGIRGAANIFQQYLRTGPLDELQIHLGAAIVAS